MKRTASQRLAEELLGDIKNGRYAIGDRFPTEADLCARSRLARGTVRDALRRIEHLGMIQRRPGAGTRVIASAPVDDYQPFAGSVDDIVALVDRTRIVHPATRTIVADAVLSARLGTRRGTRWFVVEGLRVHRSRSMPPLCWSEQYLDARLPGRDKLLRGEVSAANSITHTIEQTVSARLLDEPMAAALLATPGSAALVVTRRRSDTRGRLISVGVHTHPADRYQLKTIVETGRVRSEGQPVAGSSPGTPAPLPASDPGAAKAKAKARET